MRTYSCICGNELFFDNSVCLRCQRELGFCPNCKNLVGLEPRDAAFECGNPGCRSLLKKCANYEQHNVCNRCVLADVEAPEGLCDACQYNNTIPDLTIAGNLQKWYRLESAKRRLLYNLDQLGLPHGTAAAGFEPPLAFDFKADVIPPGDLWRKIGTGERVFTGHANGLITINIREADDVQREKLRVDMGEAHRTLIGHFRHEIGHYYWEILVRGKCEAECKEVFGDHDNPTYAEALERHYAEGPPADWAENYISAYATMHPWEDFAETFAAYLDMADTIETAVTMGFVGGVHPDRDDLNLLITTYQQLGIAMNEMNRSMGLIDLVPEVMVQPVIEKMRFIHRLIRAAAPSVAEARVA